MQSIPQMHRGLYNDNQLEQLCLLVSLLNDQTIFICDVDPEVDTTSPYFKAKDYPLWAGQKDNFLIGVDKTKKLWLLPFWTYTVTNLVGELKWTFREDTLKAISIKLYEGKGAKYFEAAKDVTKVLRENFIDCTIAITVGNIKAAVAA